MFYNSSDEEITTYSEDERYLGYIEAIHQQDDLKKLYRKMKFEMLSTDQEQIIFNLQGVNIMKFTEMKIKFCFQPSLLYKYISKTMIFYCTLRYLERYKKWYISREPIPARPLFYKVTSKEVLLNDNFEEICKIIVRIYEELKWWSVQEIRYRREKYMKYRAGKISYLDLDSIDEEIYFSDDERVALSEKRKAVLKRMIPPTKRVVLKKPRGTKLKYKIF